ncbi:RagB/SusD family nutrient uptake outer membrane protein [Algibacter pacificus]|uniref:RagB/SusD family nutrient uptake outer membrane protein n=1 Tax=Algibacter pacificus TaxID=2599389 RepID=UPI0011C90D6E|nr:RagB/SusD family nutrient uptake outer membrane protein [Algibacter pacificus]
MKNYHNIIIVFIITFCIHSCELVDVTDIEAQDVLTEETAIRDQIGAELTLAGAYSFLNDASGTLYIKSVVLQLGIEAEPGGIIGGTSSSYYVNNVDPQDRDSKNVYSGMYTISNRANYLINILPSLDDALFETGSKSKIIAEAKFLRALSHFYLLRSYGQFWDLNSKYGIVLRTEPANDAIAIPRSTVQETYDFILNDLDTAIPDLAVTSPGYYANKYAALALKARIMLYMGKYTEAAILSKDVIDNSPFKLEDTFAEVFENEFNSSEMLFATYHDDNEYSASSVLWWIYISISDYYKNFANSVNDTRISYVNYEHPTRGFINGKFRGFFDGGTNIHLRLAEVYLIYAEALARSNGDLKDIKDAINKIRNRAGMDNTNASTREELINAIRQEKLLELAVEEGEPWFDTIRYAIVDGFDISTIKPTITSKDQYILPIPYDSVTTSNNVVDQNPGYKF